MRVYWSPTGHSPRESPGSTLDLGCILPLIYDTDDTDNDGVPDEVEIAFGTSRTLADTDGDGISDLAEIQQGLDPLGGRGLPTGVIASLPISGQAKEVVVAGTAGNAAQQTAYIAAGTGGVAIVDATQFNKPLLLSQLALPGDAVDVAVDPSANVAVVAAGDGGLHFVDVSDGKNPKIIRSVHVSATQVEVVDGIAYASVGGQILSYETLTGDQLSVINIPNGNTITGMTHEGAFLYTMDADRNLQVFEVTDSGLQPRGSVQLTNGGAKISVSNGIVYAAVGSSLLQGGFDTANVSDPANPVEISPSTPALPRFQRT